MVVITIIGFFLGGIPFSYLLGRLFLKTDIRNYGDSNPGAANAWKAGGWRVGILAVILDYSKGMLPLIIAHQIYNLQGWSLLPVAVAPILGHAFSPFLRFRGGKAVAVTFGVWTALIPYVGAIALGLSIFVFFILQKNDSWTIILGTFLFFIYIMSSGVESYIIAVWCVNIVILLYKHRLDMRRQIIFRHWVTNIFRTSH